MDESYSNAQLTLPCHFLNFDHPRNNNIDFCGDQGILEEIDQTFLAERTTSERTSASTGHPELRVVLLHGLEGVGKSRIAAEYASSRKETFQTIVWLDAQSKVKLETGFNRFAERLGLSMAAHPSSTEVLNAVQNFLANPFVNGSCVKWLMIMDSAEETDIVWDFWPHLGSGCVLLTSKQPKISGLFAATSLEVKPLRKNEAAHMLLKMSRKEGEDNAERHAGQIASFWDGIPACMELVTGLMDADNLSLADFHSVQKERRGKYLLTELPSVFQRQGGSLRFLSWLTVDALRVRDEICPGQLDMLVVLCFLDGSSISEDILKFNSLVTVTNNFPRNDSDYLDCRTGLWKISAIKIVEHNGRPNELKILPTYQDAVWFRLKALGIALWTGLTTAASLVLSKWPCVITVEVSFSQLYTSRRERCQHLAVHVSRMMNLYDHLEKEDQKMSATREWIQLLTEAAWFQYEQGNASQSHRYADYGIKIYYSLVQSKQQEMLDLYAALQNTKGVAFDAMDRPLEAIKHINEFLHAQESLCKWSGKQTAKLAAAYSELAKARLECGQTDGVLELIEQSKRIRKNLHGFNELDFFNPLLYEGLYHIIYNNLDKAEQCFRQILQVREKAFEIDDVKSPSPKRYVFSQQEALGKISNVLNL
ncbi:MAG: hypothetical protein Q9160_003852 [Pyrenula sp. 1 TL-2023]